MVYPTLVSRFNFAPDSPNFLLSSAGGQLAGALSQPVRATLVHSFLFTTSPCSVMGPLHRLESFRINLLQSKPSIGHSSRQKWISICFGVGSSTSYSEEMCSMLVLPMGCNEIHASALVASSLSPPSLPWCLEGCFSPYILHYTLHCMYSILSLLKHIFAACF